MKALFFSIFLVVIMVSGAVTVGLFTTDAFATPGKDNGKSKGCVNSNEKSSSRDNNPHCNNGPDSDGDGIPDVDDPCPEQPLDDFVGGVEGDHDGDGVPDELDGDPCNPDV